MPALRRPLPPKPQPNSKSVTVISVPAEKRFKPSDQVKAIDIRIALDDGTFLHAEGGAATDIVSYLMDCARICAGHPGLVSNYISTSDLIRVDAAGNKVLIALPEKRSNIISQPRPAAAKKPLNESEQKMLRERYTAAKMPLPPGV